MKFTAMFQRATAVACCAALVAAMVPGAAFAAVADAPSAADAPGAQGDLFASVIARVERHAEIEAEADAGVYQPDSIIVTGADGTAAEDVPEGMSVADAVFAAESDPRVERAQPNYRYYPETERAGSLVGGVARALGTLAADVPVNDPAASVRLRSQTTPNQWWLHSVGALDAWQLAKCEGKVSVAVLDTGVNFEHEDLKGVVDTQWAYDVNAGTRLAKSAKSEDYAHGCHVAGIVAGEANNGTGIAGVSYNANVIPMAVFFDYYDEEDMQNYTITDDETLMEAYAYLFSDPDGSGKTIAERTNLHVINMSLGSYLGDGDVDVAFEKVIADAEDAGVLTVASGGNGDQYGARTDPHYPSDFPEVMAVTALDTDTTAAYFSDYNRNKDIAAPGCSIYSTWWGGPRSYHFADGTSMASPLVAGCAALLWAYDPGLSVAEAKEALYSTADDLGDVGFDAHFGWGRVNPAAALRSLGSVHVDVPSRTMSVTTSQALSASVIEASGHSGDYEWSWSTSDPEVATVSAAGVLTARSAGTVTVYVQAKYDSSIEGRATIAVEPIAIPGKVTAVSDRAANAVNVRWPAAAGATSYEVYRLDKPGAPIAKVAAKAGQAMFALADKAVTGGVAYTYRVQPIGKLDGARVEGDWSNQAAVSHVDRSKLRANIDSANALSAATVKATSGAKVSAKAYWAKAAAFTTLKSTVEAASSVYLSSKSTQLQVSDKAAAVASAISAFKAARKAGSVKVAQSLSAKVAAKNVSLAKVRKGDVKVSGAISVSGAKTALSYAISKVSVAKQKGKFSVNSKGVITVKKNCPRGTYKLTVKASAKATATYKAATVTKTVTLKVK